MKSNDRQPSHSTLRREENLRAKLDLPTSYELHTAIRILEKFSERLTQESAHSVIQMPDFPLGDQYAAKIGKDAAERIAQIRVVKEQLENWQQELKELRRQYVSNRI